MRELCVLVGRHLREIARGRLARPAVTLFLLAIVGAAIAGTQTTHGLPLTLLLALVAVTLLVGAAAVGVGMALPSDRVAGREAWLATLSPPAWKRRLSIGLAGWLLATGFGLCGGLVAGLAVAATHTGAQIRSSERVDIQSAALMPGAGAAWSLDLSRMDVSASTLDIEVRPVFLSMITPIDRVEIEWSTARSRGRLEASVRGPIRLPLVGGERALRLSLLTPGVNLRIRSARVLGQAVSPLGSLAWAGLLIGLLVGAVAPAAVFVSRATSGQTAAAAAFSLLLFGIGRETMLTLADDLELEGMASAAAGVLRGVSWAAPDAPLVSVVSELAAQRAMGAAAVALAIPALLYAAVALVLSALPTPRRWREGRNA